MVRFVLSTVLMLLNFLCSAQTFVWPICNQKTGEGIISQPQQYIDGQLNYEELYISAPLGETVISPVEGYICDLYVAEKKNRFEINYWDIRSGSFDETIASIVNEKGKVSNYPQYLSGYVAIKTSNGEILQIGGLRGDKKYETGMHVQQGDILGKVGYDYKAFAVPHISLTLRNSNMDPLDPLKPFGLQSQFVPLKESKAPRSLSRAAAEEDLNILFDAYKECYPLITERISEDRFSSYRDSCITSLDETIDYVHFYYMVRSTTTRQFINDSHLSLLTHIPVISEKYLVPKFRIGVLNDSLIVVATPKGMSQYLTRTIQSINGVDSNIWIQSMKDNMISYDGDALPSNCVVMLDSWNLLYGENVHNMSSQKLVFSNGEEIEDKWIVNNTISREPEGVDEKFYFRNKAESSNETFMFQQYCDSISILTLNTFSLDEKELEEIKETLLSQSPSTSLIIDLRNNSGGDEESMGKLLSLFVQTPIKNVSPYEIVNDTCSYKSFKYSSNFPENARPFSGYIYDKVKGGYCNEPKWLKHITTSKNESFQGKIYLITGESTFSAAALFASYLVRSDRAVSVGRETPTGYHDMRANKFLDLRLPNSKIDIRIPLVKCVFDEMVTNRTPANRGLLPDYYVPVSFNEVYCDTNDIVLEETLKIISQNKYINRSDFSFECEPSQKRIYIPLLCCIIFPLLAFYFIKRKHE